MAEGYTDVSLGMQQLGYLLVSHIAEQEEISRGVGVYSHKWGHFTARLKFIPYIPAESLMVQRLFPLAGDETPFGPIEAALDLGWIKKGPPGYPSGPC